MQAPRFWIVGGEYASMAFDRLIEGTQRVFGPYGERRAAEEAWRRLSEESRSQCLMRFTIAAER
ncbi:hypothetical protein OSH11_20645 [Kaistia dalseonensis]|uniref:DUF4170 domain-containing protein n=1 Tax=Kaistia dalseonensis TaxID=410840 RepID=A0ABU0HCS9_9HYPH|nr:hypothetical protein [Kaistia dalseonensis]MCX5497125.1 hypothetical protein [Kaistia dalseonensis]MDQ0439752.1 hypothetical protein [Kaistia dalseonensis]